LPAELAAFHGVDFRRTRSFDEAFGELRQLLAAPIAPLGPFLSEVPALPFGFEAREAEVAAIKTHLLPTFDPARTDASPQIVALHGMGGIGKSVLAAATVRDVIVRRSFPDGIVWIQASSSDRLNRCLPNIGQAFDPDNLPQYASLDSAKSRLGEALATRRCLIVIDDGNDLSVIETFVNALAPPSKLLVTSREVALFAGLSTAEVEVKELQDAEARRLLASWAGKSDSPLPAAASDLATRVGCLPLALTLCGAMVRNGVPWSDVLEAFEDRDLDFVETQLPNYQYSTVSRSIAVSLDRLARVDKEGVERFLDLSVFQRPGPIPQDTLLQLWCERGRTSPRDARKTLTSLCRRALLRHHEESRLLDSPIALSPMIQEVTQSSLEMHDLQFDYVKSAGPPDAATLHQALLRGYDRLRRRDPKKTFGDGYYLEYLTDHLTFAGYASVSQSLSSAARIISAREGLPLVIEMQNAIERDGLDTFLASGNIIPESVRPHWEAVWADVEREGIPLDRSAAATWLAWTVTSGWALRQKEAELRSCSQLKQRIKAEVIALQSAKAKGEAKEGQLETRYYERVRISPRHWTCRAARVEIVQSTAQLDQHIFRQLAALEEAETEVSLAMLEMQYELQKSGELMQGLSNYWKRRHDAVMVSILTVR
jgi:hypothetical protein